jgi:putative hydrolase of the HAD superfamily
LRVTPEAFLADYRTWFKGPYDGALELLDALRPRYRTACLSNANVLDVTRFSDELQLRHRLDGCFYSNELGLRKPDPEAYLHVCRTLGVPPAEVAFFDDSRENVAGALAVGMHACHVTGFPDLKRVLEELGVLS